MALPESAQDEPVTPISRLFLRQDNELMISVATFFESPINVPDFIATVESSIIIQHPRFRSLLVSDPNGKPMWRKTELNVVQHIIVVDREIFDADIEKTSSSQVNAYLADIAVSSPLSHDKPLWEMHLLVAHKCLVFRLHHAFGDAISLMSLFLTSCKRIDHPELFPTFIATSANESARRRRRRSFLDLIKILWFTMTFTWPFIKRMIWKDTETAISGGDGVELWPRKLATATFLIDDMKTVKQATPNGTINDVYFGIVSLGLSRYLALRSPEALPEGVQLTGMAIFSLRKQLGLQEITNMMKNVTKSILGNKLGYVLLPVYYHKASSGSDPLQYLKRAKAMLDRKKQSLEAPIIHLVGKFLTSAFGAKAVDWIYHRVFCNTTFLISNVAGPKEELTFGGNRVTSFRVNMSSLPQALTLVMLSYAGKAELQISTARDIIPDPEVLAKLFEDALAEMKEAAEHVLAAGKMLVAEEHCCC